MLRKAYSDHRHWQLIKNLPGQSLDDKIDSTRRAILEIVALDCETTVEQRKFQLAVKSESNGLPFTLPASDVNKVSLITMETEFATDTNDEGAFQTMRKRSVKGSNAESYAITETEASIDGGQIVTRRPITAEEFSVNRFEMGA